MFNRSRNWRSWGCMIAVVLGSFCVLLSGIAVAQTKKVTVRLANFPSGADWAIEQHIDKNKLFQKYATEYGYELELVGTPFMSGVAALEALMGGAVDHVLVGQTPAVSAIAKNLPVYLGSSVAMGHNGHAIVVRPGSEFHSLDDLVKKKATIGTLIGTTAYQFLQAVFQAAYGKTAEQMGVKIVNIPAPQALTMPKGIDAIAFWSYVPQMTVAKGVGEVLLNDWGYTGPAWTSPPGPNKRVDWVKNSPFYPEGFTQYRNYAIWSKSFADAHPKLVVAYNLAVADAVKALCQNTPAARELAWEYVKNEWGGLPKDAALEIFAADLTMGVRCWQFVTYGDVRAIVFTAAWSKANGYIDKDVSWADAKKYFAFTAPLEKEVWEKLGRVPSLEEMTKSSGVADIRGLPTWMMDKWPDEKPPAM